MTRSRFFKSHSSRGQAMVEFALLFPFFLGVFLGLMAFASVFYSYETMQLAVRQGANAIVRDCIHQTNTGISDLVKAKSFSFDQSQIQVTVSDPIPANCKSGYPITVMATYNVPFPRVNIPLLGSGTIRLGPIPISAASTMTIE